MFCWVWIVFKLYGSKENLKIKENSTRPPVNWKVSLYAHVLTLYVLKCVLMFTKDNMYVFSQGFGSGFAWIRIRF